MNNKRKKKISITINKKVLSEVEKLTTNKSRLVEYILLQYLKDNNIKTNNIVL